MGRLKILKGASSSLPASRDGDTLYFCSDGKLYNGDSLIAEKNPTVDSALSSTSTNAVQNKVVNTALAGKAANSHTHDDRYYTETEMNTKLAAKVDLTASGVSTAINKLSTGTSTPTDADYYIAQSAGGGTTTTTYHRRPLSALWTWIKSKLATVATSGSYSDLSNKPTIPTVNNATVTIKQAGTQKGSFTLNQSGATTIELTDNNTTYSAATTSAAGLMSAADKTKLDGIATGAQVNTITGVKGNAESSYRTGNVNLTPANIGAAAATHTHSYLPLSGGNVTGNVDVTGDVNAGKLIGDVMSGDIVPSASEAFSIGSSAAKYNGVYASNFYGNATSADSATKATQDGSGNNIVNTYLTKTSASSTYSPKAGSSSLTTCAKGTFGDAAVKSVTTAVTSGNSALVTSGGVYNAVQSVKNSFPSVMGMATYKAVSLSSGKLELQCLSYQGEQYLQSFSQGAVIKVIDPSGVCQGSIDRLEDGSQDTMVVNGGLSYPNSGFEGVVYYNETTELNELYITGYN